MFGGKRLYLHGTINLAAVKHEIEEIQVVQGRFPRHVFSVIDQVLGGLEGQHCRDDLCPLGLQDCENECDRFLHLDHHTTLSKFPVYNDSKYLAASLSF